MNGFMIAGAIVTCFWEVCGAKATAISLELLGCDSEVGRFQFEVEKIGTSLFVLNRDWHIEGAFTVEKGINLLVRFDIEEFEFDPS